MLVRVRDWLVVLHQILNLKPGEFEIGTVTGRSDGWVSATDIFGRVVTVDE